MLQGAGLHPSAGVHEGEQPLRGIPIAIYHADAKSPPERPADVEDPADWRHSDAEGLARFEGREPGRYRIRAWLDGDSIVTGDTGLEEAGGSRFVLRLGEGVVHGRIFTPDGAPWSDTSFHLGVTPRAGHAIGMSARCDEAGRFRFAHVPSGFCLLLQDPAVEQQGFPRARARFALDSKETLEIVFGDRTSLVAWTGTLRAGSGEAIELALGIGLDEANQGRQHRFSTGDDGRFRVELPAGDYMVGPEGGWGTEGFLHVELGADPLERDLVLPLITLRLTTPPDEFAAYTGFELERVDANSTRVQVNRRTSKAGGVERFAFRVPPARYRLVAKGSGRIAGAPDEGLDLDLTGKDGLVSIDVSLVPR